jgi:hypothetical protein
VPATAYDSAVEPVPTEVTPSTQQVPSDLLQVSQGRAQPQQSTSHIDRLSPLVPRLPSHVPVPLSYCLQAAETPPLAPPADADEWEDTRPSYVTTKILPGGVIVSISSDIKPTDAPPKAVEIKLVKAPTPPKARKPKVQSHMTHPHASPLTTIRA